ncbi:MAG: hypothetical protein IT292_08595 [Deltaproteobacteria bacterium]|nr:hypothetical protein [Deltaproteobacteria bacterium]
MSITGINSGLKVIQLFNRATQESKPVSSSDADNDSRTSELSASFDVVDSNKDGTVTLDELLTYDKSGQINSACQHDGSKALSEDEFIQMCDHVAAASGDTTAFDKALESFSSVDSDGEGKASSDEFLAFVKANGLSLPQPPAGAPHGPRGEGHKPLEFSEGQHKNIPFV